MSLRQTLIERLDLSVPAHVREEFTLHSARHMRGQAQLIYIGFILSLPMVVLGRATQAPDWIALGLPLGVLCLSLWGLWGVSQPVRDRREAAALIARSWTACLACATLGSLWCVGSWLYAPEGTRIYYVAVMTIGALTLGYTLTATRFVGLASLLVTLGPISVALLTTGTRLDVMMASGLLIGVVFQLVMMNRHRRMVVQLIEERQRADGLARIDSLTGIANRRALLEHAQALGVGGRPIRLMIADIDRFKQVNDRYGHETGDEVIMIVATLLSEYGSEDVLVARLGGEEYALLGPADRLSAQAAHRFLADVREAEMPHGATLTVSAGVACSPEDGEFDWATLYSAADTAMYDAKHRGRDCVVEAGDLAADECDGCTDEAKDRAAA